MKTRVRSEGEKNPFPVLGTLCTKRGLVRIRRKDNKSIILYLEGRTKRPGHAVDTLAGPFAIQLVVCVASPDALPYPHGSAATGEGRAPVH